LQRLLRSRTFGFSSGFILVSFSAGTMVLQPPLPLTTDGGRRGIREGAGIEDFPFQRGK
jgi:hypothetical protein